jgi:hypothetical protein
MSKIKTNIKENIRNELPTEAKLLFIIWMIITTLLILKFFEINFTFNLTL